MAWTTGRRRTLDEKRRISKGVSRYYSRTGPFIRTRNILDYKEPYNYGRKIKSLMQRISGSGIPTWNKGKLIEFGEELSLYTKPGHVYNSMRVLFVIFSDYRRRLGQITEADAMALYTRIQKSDIADYTKFSRVARLKFFLTWLNNGAKPDYLRKMRSRKKPKADKYISLDDVRRFLEACESDEERAFFALLWEGGFSVGELLKLRRRDVTVRPGMLDVYVESKQRDRTTPILKAWGRMFPLGAYRLFLKHLNNLRLEPDDRAWSMVAYNQVQYRVNKIKKKVGLYHLRTHSFRKARATYNDENGMSYAQNCIYGGWHIGSRTLQHYILTSGRTLVPTLKALNVVRPGSRISRSPRTTIPSRSSLSVALDRTHSAP